MVHCTLVRRGRMLLRDRPGVVMMTSYADMEEALSAISENQKLCVTKTTQKTRLRYGCEDIVDVLLHSEYWSQEDMLLGTRRLLKPPPHFSVDILRFRLSTFYLQPMSF